MTLTALPTCILSARHYVGGGSQVALRLRNREAKRRGSGGRKKDENARVCDTRCSQSPPRSQEHSALRPEQGSEGHLGKPWVESLEENVENVENAPLAFCK